MKYVVIFLCVVAVKLYINASKFFCAKRLREKYKDSFKNDGKPFEEYIPKTRKMFIDIGAGNTAIPVAQPLGYHQIATTNAEIIKNLDSRRSDIVDTIMVLFDEAVGTYRMRMVESISPSYWIETLLFLPSRALKYLGCEPDKLISKLFQLIYWIAVPLFIAFRSELYQHLLLLLQQAK